MPCALLDTMRGEVLVVATLTIGLLSRSDIVRDQLCPEAVK